MSRRFLSLQTNKLRLWQRLKLSSRSLTGTERLMTERSSSRHTTELRTCTGIRRTMAGAASRTRQNTRAVTRCGNTCAAPTTEPTVASTIIPRLEIFSTITSTIIPSSTIIALATSTNQYFTIMRKICLTLAALACLVGVREICVDAPAPTILCLLTACLCLWKGGVAEYDKYDK